MKPYIPQPCHEDWNAMTENEKGRHCDVCAKVVVDFTKMSDAEMIHYLQQHQHQKTCGHFRNEQLYQPEKLEINLATIPTNLSFRKYFAIALLITFTSFGLVSCKSNSGRTVGEIEVIDSAQKPVINSSILGDTVIIPDTIANEILGNICIKPSDSVKSKKVVKVNKPITQTQQEDVINQVYTTGIMIAPTDTIQK
ncbi:MAG: hypothetical protein U0U67_00850 [Chitinophagales bacterium]